jgi:hypothetical protein
MTRKEILLLLSALVLCFVIVSETLSFMGVELAGFTYLETPETAWEQPRVLSVWRYGLGPRRARPETINILVVPIRFGEGIPPSKEVLRTPVSELEKYWRTVSVGKHWFIQPTILEPVSVNLDMVVRVNPNWLLWWDFLQPDIKELVLLLTALVYLDENIDFRKYADAGGRITVIFVFGEYSDLCFTSYYCEIDTKEFLGMNLDGLSKVSLIKIAGTQWYYKQPWWHEWGHKLGLIDLYDRGTEAPSIMDMCWSIVYPCSRELEQLRYIEPSSVVSAPKGRISRFRLYPLTSPWGTKIIKIAGTDYQLEARYREGYDADVSQGIWLSSNLDDYELIPEHSAVMLRDGTTITAEFNPTYKLWVVRIDRRRVR